MLLEAHVARSLVGYFWNMIEGELYVTVGVHRVRPIVYIVYRDLLFSLVKVKLGQVLCERCLIK